MNTFVPPNSIPDLGDSTRSTHEISKTNWRQVSSFYLFIFLFEISVDGEIDENRTLRNILSLDEFVINYPDSEKNCVQVA
jgi:hypothetical protein